MLLIFIVANNKIKLFALTKSWNRNILSIKPKITIYSSILKVFVKSHNFAIVLFLF